MTSQELLPLLVRLLGASVKESAFTGLSSSLALVPDQHGSLTYWENESLGLCVVSRTELVVSVMFFASGKDGFAEYSGALPEGLAFDMPRNAVRSTLGSPVASGGPALVETAGTANGGWDKFDLDDYSLHITYSALSSAPELLTLVPRQSPQ